MAEIATLVTLEPTIACVCMYCKREYKRILCSPDQVGLVSHGVCSDPACIERLWQAAGIMRPSRG